MSKTLDIPVVVESGQKFVNAQGIKALKDGVKSTVNAQTVPLRKPSWLRMQAKQTPRYNNVRNLVHDHQLSTVCEEAKCPNISECWSHGTATIMVMGSVCTRACRFCSVDTGNPKGWLDQDEPVKTAYTVKTMDLEYVVITSVDRDDLADGGAQHFADTVAAVKAASPQTAVEVLTPDFSGQHTAVDLLVSAGIDVFAQNVETIERLTHTVRDPKAGYQRTLNILAYSKKTHPTVLTKTSLMVGLGETDEELYQCMQDIRAHGVDIITLGQYLRPTINHLPVKRYVDPQQFKQYEQWGKDLGFIDTVAGPLVRSSYRAERSLGLVKNRHTEQSA